MKKIGMMIVLGAIFLMMSGTVLATVGDKCCDVSHCSFGETCSKADGSVVGSDCKNPSQGGWTNNGICKTTTGTVSCTGDYIKDKKRYRATWTCTTNANCSGNDCCQGLSGTQLGQCRVAATPGGSGMETKAPTIIELGDDIGGGDMSLPEECVILKGDVKMNDGQGGIVTYKEGIVLAPKAVTDAECPRLKAVQSPCSTSGVNSSSCWTKDFGIVVALGLVNKITNWLFMILMLAVVAMIIWGGLLYVFSSGDPTKTGKAKGVLTFAIVGLAVALLAKIIPSLVRFVIGVQ